MLRRIVTAAALSLALPALAFAQQDKIASAMSAGPASVSSNAAVRDWDGTELRPGTNGWTCLPDRPDTEATDPWCVTGPWLQFIDAYANKTEPKYDKVGVAYMLVGDAPVSNTDPYATEKTSDADWVEDAGPHLMVIVPDRSSLSGLPTDPDYGGPWVMWANTPYAHIMIPTPGGAGH